MVATRLSVQDIATALGGEAFGDTALLVERPVEPGEAGTDDLALALSPAYADALRQGDARAAIVWDSADWTDLGLKAAIIVPRARLGLAHLTRLFVNDMTGRGVHATAVIDPSAHIGIDASVGPFCVIGPDVTIGARTHLASQVTLEQGAVIGEDGRVAAGVRIGRAVSIGDRVILHHNAVIGADGFSFATADAPNEERAARFLGRGPITPPEDAVRHKVYSLGSVEIGDDVEIGANACVDAGTIRPTRVGSGTKVDNIVQIGHNVVVGRDCVFSAQAAIAGSAHIGDRVVMGGKSGIRDNVTIGSDTVLGGGAIVLNDLPAGSFVMGYPAQDMKAHRDALKAVAALVKGRVSKPGRKD